MTLNDPYVRRLRRCSNRAEFRHEKACHGALLNDRNAETEFELAGFLPYQFNVIAGRLSRDFEKRYKSRFGITVAQWRVVAHLHEAGTVSVREIHRKVDMDKSKVSRAAARLESSGYITKRQSASDRRLVDLALTAKGREMMCELSKLALSYQKELLASIEGNPAAFVGTLRAWSALD